MSPAKVFRQAPQAAELTCQSHLGDPPGGDCIPAIIVGMAMPGPTTQSNIEHAAGNLLKVARLKAGVTQRGLATAASVAQSTVARIESGTTQPTLPMLYRLLAALDLEPRIRLEPYDDHDDVLDQLKRQFPVEHERATRARDEILGRLANAQ